MNSNSTLTKPSPSQWATALGDVEGELPGVVTVFFAAVAANSLRTLSNKPV
jgi:hypothetical protein